MTRTSFTVSDTFARELSSRGDEVLKAVAQSAECKVYLRGDEVMLDGDDAHVETYYLFVSTAAQPPHLASFGRYIDHFQKRGGEWRIANRICSIEGVFGLDDHPFATAHVATHYPPGEEPYRHDRLDVSYQRPVRPRPIPAKPAA